MSTERTYTIVTYSCGHEVTFSESAPKVDECNICLKCLEETIVVDIRTERKEKIVQ